MHDIWNPWHGCKKLSPGCANCYVYRRDDSIGKDASIVTKTNVIQKKVDLANVMYTFRSKAIVGFVADAMDFRSRDTYCNFLKKQIMGHNSDKYLQVISKYLPIIPIAQ